MAPTTKKKYGVYKKNVTSVRTHNKHLMRITFYYHILTRKQIKINWSNVTTRKTAAYRVSPAASISQNKTPKVWDTTFS